MDFVDSSTSLMFRSFQMSSAAQIGKDSASKKRKEAPSSRYKDPKRKKVLDYRKISSQTVDEAFSNGELNVNKFVRAREYEIKALDDAIRNSKKALSTRAFQEVPRSMRRRTASYNFKQVPKRLRTRVKKEMVEDNTPTGRRRKPTSKQRLRQDTVTRLQKLRSKLRKEKQKRKERGDSSREMDGDKMAVDIVNPDEGSQQDSMVKPRKPRVKKNILKTPPLQPAKFRKRQIHKTWLPTHLFHAKRARMTPPKEPLWRFAIPLTPTAKSYRTAHRSSLLRGAVAWDTSYMSSISLEGQQKSLEGLLKAIGVGAGNDPEGVWGYAGEKWRRGARALESPVFKRESWPNNAIASAIIIWDSQDTLNPSQEKMDLDKPLPSKREKRKAIIRVHPAAFMQLWEELVKLSKVQKPAVVIEDLRFEIGSIEVTGPNSTEALVGILWPIMVSDTKTTPSQSVEGIWASLASLQNTSALPENALFSFEISDPRLHHPSRTVEIAKSLKHEPLMRLLTSWPLDYPKKSMSIFDRKRRQEAARSLPSQKSINRRKSLAMPGDYPEPQPTDPKIPVLLVASRCGNGNQGSWIVLLPWKCVRSVWYTLLYYPLSIGGNVQFAGLNEKRQIAFEAGNPSFPADHPGTEAGYNWELQERQRLKAEWDRKPNGRRTAWDSIDLGRGRKGEVGLGWACDWERLLGISELSDKKLRITQLPSVIARQRLAQNLASKDAPKSLITVKISMISRGTPQTRARIYRLPTNDEKLKEMWRSLLHQRHPKKLSKPSSSLLNDKEKAYSDQLNLITSAIMTPITVHPNSSSYPEVPDEIDLIGFVTTGNFNLAEGKGIGVGSLLLSKLLRGEEPHKKTGAGIEHLPRESGTPERNLCIVRDAGERFGRLAKWELV